VVVITLYALLADSSMISVASLPVCEIDFDTTAFHGFSIIILPPQLSLALTHQE
jgi:hypothetical protein